MEDQDRKIPPRIIAEAVNRVLEEDGVGVLATLVEGSSNVGAKLLVQESGALVGSLGHTSLDSAVALYAFSFLESRNEAKTLHVGEFAPELAALFEARILFERIQPEPRIVICGAGHVGASLARLASFLGYRTTLIDDRAEFVTHERFPDERIELRAAKSWAEATREAVGHGRGVSVAVVTRGHSEDEECLRGIISTNADYIGLIGSKRRTNIVLDRLRSAGTDAAAVERVRAPVGLDIGAVTPEEVALSILAEIVAERRGGQGGSLSAWRRLREVAEGKRKEEEKN